MQFGSWAMPPASKMHGIMQTLPRALFALAVSVAALWPRVAPAAASQADTAAIARVAQDYLRGQLAALPGTPAITLDPIDAARHPACAELLPFLPSALRPRARMTVGVRCAAPQSWTLYVQATVSVPGQYYVAARPIPAGQALRPDDLAAREGDLVTLPRGVMLDAQAILGMRARSRIAAGQTIRASALRSAEAVTRGQQVRITAQGRGFVVSGEGEALDDAPPGAAVQVRTPSGQIVSGIVRSATLVEVTL